MAPLLSFKNLDNRLFLDGRFFGFSGGSGPTGLGFNYGYEFDGVDESISFGNVLDQDGSSAFSISAWVKLISTAGRKIIVSKYDQSLVRGYGLYVYGNKLTFFIEESNGNNLFADTSTVLLSANTWHNVKVTYDGSKDYTGVTFYIDDTTCVTSNVVNNFTGSSSHSQPFKIGVGGTSTWWYGGRIDDVQFYNFELNAAQSQDIYNNGYVTAPTASPIHHWKLGEDDAFSTNWSVNDAVGSLNGTSVNMEEADRKLGVAYSITSDGVDERVTFSPYIDLGTENTISFWLYKDSVGSSDVVIGASSYDYTVEVNSGGTTYYKVGSTTKPFNESMAINTWYHMVFVRNGDTANLFLNGIKNIKTCTGYGTINSTEISCLFSQLNGLFGFSGKLMYISAFNNALSDSDAIMLYNNGVPTDPRDLSLNPTFFAPLGGPNDSFSTNWTFVDEIGGNNGTSVNMEETDKTSETP